MTLIDVTNSWIIIRQKKIPDHVLMLFLV